MKRILSLILAVLLLLGTGITAALAEERITLTIAVGANALIDDYQNNLMTQYLEDYFGVKLKMEVWSEPKTKLSMQINTNAELPDIICFNLDDSTVYEYGRKGAFIALDDYYADPEVAVNYHKIPEIYPGRNYKDLLDEGSLSPDGHRYVIPLLGEYFPNEIKYGMWINQVWLEQLGLENPKTPEEFKSMLEAFTSNDMNGNGIADEIGMMGSTAWGSNAAAMVLSFFCDANPDYKYFSVKDGTIYPQFMTEDFKAGLKYLRSLVEENLLDPASFTQSDTQLKAIINTENDIALVGVLSVYNMGKFNAPTIIPTGWRVECDHPVGKQYDIVEWPKVSEEKGNMIYVKPSTVNWWFITRDCKEPELAFRMGDLFFDPLTQLCSRHGWEGVNWTKDPEVLKDIYAAKIDGVRLETKWYVTQDPDPITQHYTWRQQNPGLFAYEFNMYRGWVTDPDKVTTMENVFNKFYHKFYNDDGSLKVESIGKLKFTEEETEDLTFIKTSVDTYVSECITAFATGNMDVDRDWDNYIEQLKSMDVDRYTEIMQASYDRVNK